jgi:hypothetical protein
MRRLLLIALTPRRRRLSTRRRITPSWVLSSFGARWALFHLHSTVGVDMRADWYIDRVEHLLSRRNGLVILRISEKSVCFEMDMGDGGLSFCFC